MFNISAEELQTIFNAYLIILDVELAGEKDMSKRIEILSKIVATGELAELIYKVIISRDSSYSVEYSNWLNNAK